MSQPLISVIMTVRNCEKFIEESLLSIFEQDFKDFELIIFDDYSTDRTGEIIESMLSPQKLYFFLEKKCKYIKGLFFNRGVGAGRNRAIKEAKGEYIAIQDGDDISYRWRFEDQIYQFEKDKDLFCVGGGITHINEKGHKIDPQDTYQPEKNEDIYNKMLIKKINPIYDPTAMFSRKLFNDLGGYEENEYKLVPDLILWRKAMKKGFKFYNRVNTLVRYREHSGSNMKSHLKEVAEQHNAVCSIY